MGMLGKSAEGDCELWCYSGDEIESPLGFCVEFIATAQSFASFLGNEGLNRRR